MPAAPILATETGVGDVLRSLVRRGRIHEAIGVALSATSDQRDPHDQTGATAQLVECRLAQGDLGAALALGEQLSTSTDHPEALLARAELASAVGEADLAVERYLAASRCPDVDALAVPWRAGAALALVRLGRRAEALELARTQHAVALARGTAYDVALALRVLATTEPDSQCVPRLREALALTTAIEAGRLRAQVETDLAALLLLGGDRASALVLLRSAEGYAAREDLWPLQSRVRRVLDRMGEQPRRLEAEALAVLTAAERRVAVLALEGMTNRQIAERLLVSIKAVEGHLSKVYRKLGLASRTALVASLSLAG